MSHRPRTCPTSARPTPRLAALAVAGLLAASLTACGSDDEPADDPTDTASSEATPTDEASPPEETPDAEEPVGDEPLVYYATEVTTGVRLVAEPTPPEAGADDDVLTAVANLAASGTPVDPDYRNLIADATGATGDELAFSSVEVDDELGAIRAVLDGAGAATRPSGVPASRATLAVQALVYTLQSAADSKLPVQVVDAEGNPTSLLGVDTSSGVRAARPLRVLSLVNVLTPLDATTVSGSVEVEGRASSFEGTVRLQVLDPAGEVVVDTSAQGTFDPNDLTPWSETVDLGDLDAGRYLLVAQTDDPTGGTEGPGPNEDTKTLVVE